MLPEPPQRSRQTVALYTETKHMLTPSGDLRRQLFLFQIEYSWTRKMDWVVFEDKTIIAMQMLRNR